MHVKTGKVIFNENKVKMLGLEMSDFKDVNYKAFMNLVHPDDYDRVMKSMRDHLEGKIDAYDVEYRIRAKNGNYKWYYDRGSIVSFDSNKKPLVVKGVVIDITKIKQSENLEKLSNRVLYTLNKSGNKENEIRDILLLIKQYNDFEAVGIRIKQGENFPYYVTNGFKPSFIKKADNICKKNTEDKKSSNESKSANFECMCGDILTGKTDPSLPFFTNNGSFWTNNLLGLINKNNLIKKSFTRKDCINHGYESIALIPIRTDNEIIGVIQINDKRKDVFSFEIIRVLEAIGFSIGISFARDQALNDLELSEKRYSLAQISANIGSWDWDIITGELIWSETIEPLFGFKKGGFKRTYNAFLDCVHPEDRDFVIKSVNDCLYNKKRYAIEHRIVWPNGKVRWVSERGDVIRDKKDKPIRMLGVVQDITNKKEMEQELKKRKENLEKIVEERTKELVDINKKLKEEIVERRKAEEYSNRTKQHLRDVIDSADEIIISFDMNNRVTIWNKTTELVTGFKQLEVLNRSVGKIEVFEDPDDIIEFSSKVCSKKESKTNDIVLKNKNNEKRIIRVSGSEIVGINNECVGVLFIGKDITKDLELHKQLLEGNSYSIKDKSNQSSIDLLIDLTINNYQGLIITRGSPSYIKRIIPETKSVITILLSSETQKGYENISNLENLKSTIKDFIQKNKKTVILLDGIHYLISKFSFDDFIDTLFVLNDYIAQKNSILFIRIDPSTVDKNQMAVFENELQNLPEQRVEDLIIEDFLYEKLSYINEQNQINAIVSFKKIMSRFNISYVTAASRLNTLENKGLIYTKKQGKLRAIFITDKGKSLLHKRKTA
jgi:PAS domain S-box-containing protein